MIDYCVVVSLSTDVWCEDRCPPPWLLIDGSCYALSTWFDVTERNFMDSRIFYQSQGGDLVILEKPTEIYLMKQM